MPSFDDYDLNPPARGPFGPAPSNRARWAIIIGVLLVIAAGVGYFLLRRNVPQEPAASTTPAPAVAQEQKGTALTGENIVLPPLPETDPVVRELVGSALISSDGFGMVGDKRTDWQFYRRDSQHLGRSNTGHAFERVRTQSSFPDEKLGRNGVC